MLTVEEYLTWRQPGALELLWCMWPLVEDDLTLEQKELERLMKQRPRAGKVVSE